MRPRILLLFCNAGGGSVGYARAGFDVTGVDILPQPRNPAYWSQEEKDRRGVGDADFEFIQGDALAVLAELDLRRFAAVHGSPPCQKYSWAAKRWTNIERADLLDPTRQAFRAARMPYVIENVIGAPMPGAVTLCGLSFDITGAGLHNGEWPEVLRHRQFETNWPLTPPRHVRHVPGGVAQGIYCTVAGHGGENAKGRGGRVHKQRAMGIDWMNDRELNEAIPPQYLTHVGLQLYELVRGFSRCCSFSAFDQARRGAGRQENLTPDEVPGAEYWLTHDSRAGFGVTPDGELISLFNYGAPGQGHRAALLAIARGARHLNCYDGFLVDYYKDLGFVEVNRVAFDDQYAPPGYDYARLGRPDVVFMERTS